MRQFLLIPFTAQQSSDPFDEIFGGRAVRTETVPENTFHGLIECIYCSFGELCFVIFFFFIPIFIIIMI